MLWKPPLGTIWYQRVNSLTGSVISRNRILPQTVFREFMMTITRTQYSSAVAA